MVEFVLTIYGVTVLTLMMVMYTLERARPAVRPGVRRGLRPLE